MAEEHLDAGRKWPTQLVWEVFDAEILYVHLDKLPAGIVLMWPSM